MAAEMSMTEPPTLADWRLMWGFSGPLYRLLYLDLSPKSSQYSTLWPATRKSVGDAKGTPGFIPGVPLGTADEGTGLNPAPVSFHFRKDFPASRA